MESIRVSLKILKFHKILKYSCPLTRSRQCQYIPQSEVSFEWLHNSWWGRSWDGLRIPLTRETKLNQVIEFIGLLVFSSLKAVNLVLSVLTALALASRGIISIKFNFGSCRNFSEGHALDLLLAFYRPLDNTVY